MSKLSRFRAEIDARLRMLEQQLKAQADELRDARAKLARLDEKEDARHSAFKERLDDICKAAGTLYSRIENLQEEQCAADERLSAHAEALDKLNARLDVLERSPAPAPELPGGLTAEQLVDEVYRMCGLGADDE